MGTRRVLAPSPFAVLGGLGSASFLVAFPPIVDVVWHRHYTPQFGRVALGLTVVLALAWCAGIVAITSNAVRLWRGQDPLFTSPGMVWLASVVVALLSAAFNVTAARGATVPDLSTAATAAITAHGAPSAPPWRLAAAEDPPDRSPHTVRASVAGQLPWALVAKRRRDELSRRRTALDDDEVDAAIADLRHYDEGPLRVLRRRIGDQAAGLVTVGPADTDDGEAHELHDPTVAVVVNTGDDGATVAFARVGFALPAEDLERVEHESAVISGAGQCVPVTTPAEALRALALRRSFDDVVLYLGPAADLDGELARRCVTVDAAEPSPHRGTTSFGFTVADPVAPTAGPRVQLLCAAPVVVGLVEPFAAQLRRRCVEMTAYLAVHRGEPVTGERLRARVLGHGDDASVRTLANTASAVRRSLGATEHGPRLRPVTAAGLYQLDGVSCDLLEFHALVDGARRHPTSVPERLRRALTLIEGEPMAAALRGFEWFLAEGHLARLQRDGEWAALALAAAARQAGDYDLAFWAIERGRLLDPYSEALEAALHRVPRLRQFGGDGGGRAQDQPVGAD